MGDPYFSFRRDLRNPYGKVYMLCARSDEDEDEDEPFDRIDLGKKRNGNDDRGG